MGIALFALSGLFKNLSSLPRVQPLAVKRPLGRLHPVWASRPASCPTQGLNSPRTTPQTQRLRILRIDETGQSAECAGRMVISGRMADVCAELDRLVALEAKQLRS
jgi:hypothetical protein